MNEMEIALKLATVATKVEMLEKMMDEIRILVQKINTDVAVNSHAFVDIEDLMRQLQETAEVVGKTLASTRNEVKDIETKLTSVETTVKQFQDRIEVVNSTLQSVKDSINDHNQYIAGSKAREADRKKFLSGVKSDVLKNVIMISIGVILAALAAYFGLSVKTE